ncbi:hypothetical protein CFP65_6118 [Kitasatospora sp. MMS16-BH015]|uniref:hypothetical protein n=1 Tax=Kitasatospora sp. MMS16-BH015 TaxID=2018025 RepID=UPI000CA3F11F|nr:hypothetical protein [Kitasatospora sp. MMS16-BH015]AUG80786.1 hypothetical protein CFP65_6118 [Kitasatospora sp. MMS16-BH015]
MAAISARKGAVVAGALAVAGAAVTWVRTRLGANCLVAEPAGTSVPPPPTQGFAEPPGTSVPPPPKHGAVQPMGTSVPPPPHH